MREEGRHGSLAPRTEWWASASQEARGPGCVSGCTGGAEFAHTTLLVAAATSLRVGVWRSLRAWQGHTWPPQTDLVSRDVSRRLGLTPS